MWIVFLLLGLMTIGALTFVFTAWVKPWIVSRAQWAFEPEADAKVSWREMWRRSAWRYDSWTAKILSLVVLGLVLICWILVVRGQ